MAITTYTPMQREQAVLRAQEIGPTAAGKELQIRPGTIAYWQHQARNRPSTEPTHPTAVVPSEVKPDAASQVGKAPPPLAPVESKIAPRQKSSVKRVAKVYTPSERARALECAGAEGITAAGKKFGISRSDINVVTLGDRSQHAMQEHVLEILRVRDETHCSKSGTTWGHNGVSVPSIGFRESRPEIHPR